MATTAAKTTVLKLRYLIGCVFQKQEWKTRVVTDADTLSEIEEWTAEHKRQGWDDFAAIGNRLYLRRFVPRWSWPT